MVAPVDTFVFFVEPDDYDRFRSNFESRSGTGGGRVLTAIITDEITNGVDAARHQIGDAPLGVVVSREGDALEAIEAGADEATVLLSDKDEAVTAFLDRVRIHARLRSERERQHRDFAHAEKLAALGTLIAGVAHEVNNPLSTITLGYGVLRGNLLTDLRKVSELRALLRQGEVSREEMAQVISGTRTDISDIQSLLDDIGVATESVTEMVRDLRVFSRSDASEHAVTFHLQTAIEQALRIIRSELGPRTVVEIDLQDNLPELHLPRNRLAQVLTNLLVNAAHATREVERELHRIRIAARVDDQYLALSISDTGSGIPEDALEKIFDPFFTTKREGHGTGLGLSISRSIIQHMGGDLAVSSVDGDGATFVCFLPLPDEEILQSTRRQRESVPTEPPLGPTKSVLLVDDDPRVLRVAARVLRDRFRILIARDGREASELLESGSHADIVVMELALPEMDGPEFFEWLSENRPELTSRVVVMTASQEREEFRRFLELHSPPVVHKPPSREALLAAVSKVSRNVEQEENGDAIGS